MPNSNGGDVVTSPRLARTTTPTWSADRLSAAIRAHRSGPIGALRPGRAKILFRPIGLVQDAGALAAETTYCTCILVQRAP
jgi:hypothetical protein